jgi:hypothetical protein
LFTTSEQPSSFVDCRFAPTRHYGKQTLRALNPVAIQLPSIANESPKAILIFIHAALFSIAKDLNTSE